MLLYKIVSVFVRFKPRLLTYIKTADLFYSKPRLATLQRNRSQNGIQIRGLKTITH